MTLLAGLLSTALAPAVTVTPVKVVEGLRPIAFAAAPTGAKFAASMEDGAVRIIDSKSRQTVRTLARHPQAAYALAWSYNGAFVASGDETARIWIENAVTGERVREYRTHTKGIQKLSFNLPGTMLISTGKDDQVNVYDLRKNTPKEARSILGKGTNFYGATFSPKLSYTFVVGMLNGGGARAYDASTGNTVGFLADKQGQGVFDVAFNPNATRIITAGKDATAVVWDAKTEKLLARLRGHTDWVVSAATSPNGRLIATSSSDGTVKVWNMFSYQKIADFKAPAGIGSPLAFTADGATLVSVSDQGYLQYNRVSPAQPAPRTPARPVRRRR